jgi:steroid 5-alpha reductase family enzyme
MTLFDSLSKICTWDYIKISLDLTEGDPFFAVLKTFGVITIYCLFAAELTGNYSKVDQLWSITPWLYCWILYAHEAEKRFNARLLLVCSLTTLWGLRLTYNFWRRGGYGNLISHEEDYRWPILRRKINNRFLFSLFNATFIGKFLFDFLHLSQIVFSTLLT